ncbi:MAG: hypothetical protein M3O30_17350 [Planctomycetota bacterium]|nr:hypothetical protein [Planctomycetota bacterium]
MKYIRLAEHHLPVAGGLLDQAKSFCDAMDWVNNEKRRWKAETSSGS